MSLLLTFVEVLGLNVVTSWPVEPVVPMGVLREVAGMVTRSPLPLEVLGELVFMMTGDPLVILMVFTELGAVVTRGSLVPLEVSRELVAMVTGGLLVPPEISRELVAIVNRTSLVPLEVSRELVAMETGGLLVPPEISRELVAIVNRTLLVALEVSRGLVAMVSLVIVGNPVGFITETPGVLVASGISMSFIDFLIESSLEIVDSDTGLPLLAVGEVSGEDTTSAI